MSLLELILIEDFILGFPDFGSFFGFIIVIIIALKAKSMVIAYFLPHINALWIVVIIFTVLLPLISDKTNFLVSITLKFLNILIGFAFYSIVIYSFNDGYPISAYLAALLNSTRNLLGGLFLMISTMISMMVETIILPFIAIPIIQSLIWRIIATIYKPLKK